MPSVHLFTETTANLKLYWFKGISIDITPTHKHKHVCMLSENCLQKLVTVDIHKYKHLHFEGRPFSKTFPPTPYAHTCTHLGAKMA